MKIGILGAGISGLAIGRMLNDFFDVQILEKDCIHGGIARTRDIDGIAYHLTGGHCFNSKHNEVLDFVFNKVLSKEDWNKIERKAMIKFKSSEISYPIEFSVKEIYSLDKELAINIVDDFLNCKDDGCYQNLEDWFRKKFGNTLSEEYFIPYNRKIWNKDPKNMSPLWVEGKLPIPNKESFIESLLTLATDKMPHSSFYYPKSNNQNTFIDALASNLDIIYNTRINTIEKDGPNSSQWIINDKFKYDLIINTVPLDILPNLIKNCPKDVLHAATMLEYNKVTTMLWETKATKNTWTYDPDESSLFHRYIHIGNFFDPVKNVCITEAIGEISYEEMFLNGKKDPFLIKPLDYNVSNHAYVVYNKYYLESKNIILQYLNDTGIRTLGRFGEWEYYNMDVCIKNALILSDKIKNISNK